jgi:hypothetical protein
LAGSYTVTPSAATGIGLSNYTIGYVAGTFTVNSWTITGFYQPVDMGNIVNTVKGGSTVPLKFNIYAGGVERTSVTDVMYQTVQVAEYGCSGGFEDPMGDLPNTITPDSFAPREISAGTRNSPGAFVFEPRITRIERMLCYLLEMETPVVAGVSPATCREIAAGTAASCILAWALLKDLRWGQRTLQNTALGRLRLAVA